MREKSQGAITYANPMPTGVRHKQEWSVRGGPVNGRHLQAPSCNHEGLCSKMPDFPIVQKKLAMQVLEIKVQCLFNF